MPEIRELRVLESPSRIRQYTECELLGELSYKQRWEPKEAHASLPARLRGNAFAKACESIHGAIRDNQKELLEKPEFIQAAVETSVTLFERQYEYCVTRGITFKPDTDSISKAELRRVIPLYAHHTPFKTNWGITHVEHTIPDYRSRPDLAGVEPSQFRFVGDMKYKSSLDNRWLNDTIEEFHWDPQFQQYPEALRSLLGLSQDECIYSVLCLVIGTPFSVRTVQWLYTPEQIRMWRSGADAMTQRINEINNGRAPVPSTVHRNKFGWCPMKKFCLDYNLDAERAANDYVQLSELPE